MHMSKSPLQNFGEIVRARRKSLGLSLESLAGEALGNLDRKGYVSEIERGLQRTVPATTIAQISKVVGLRQEAVDAIFAPVVIQPVIVKLGIIKAERVDLTVLPVSGKLKKFEEEGDQNRIDIAHYGLPAPSSLESSTFPKGPIGHISDLLVPQHHTDQSPQVIYATTSNGGSTAKDIYQIGMKLGVITLDHPGIRLIESPLLGTGKGGLPISEAVKSLASGFISTRHPHAILRLKNFTGANVEEAMKAILELAE